MNTLVNAPAPDNSGSSTPAKIYTFNNRELSWLAFNHRVLQEAKDPQVPLYERLKFMAIYSSNLDEFFKVRVAYLRSLAALKKKTQKKELDFDPKRVLKKVHRIVNTQREEYTQLFDEVKEELKKHQIFFIDETEVNSEHYRYLKNYFDQQIEPVLNPVFLLENVGPVFLPSDIIYLAVRFPDNEGDFVYSLIEIPSSLPRFIQLPQLHELDNKYYIIPLDDVIRLFINQLFDRVSVDSVYSIKVTRDAELYIYDEYSGNLVDKVKKSLSKRNMGVPSRFLYDKNMPDDFLKYLKKVLALTDEDLVQGRRYHNFRNLFAFPNPFAPALEYEPLPPLPLKALDAYPSMLEAIMARDWLLHFPYQSYDYLTRFLQEAAHDPFVTKIRISIYRVAVGNSKIIASLIEAARNGKEVNVFVEVKARFDEENNIYWSNELLKAGAKVMYSLPGLKVHSKTCVITRKEGGKQTRYAMFSTGNFNEKTARVYGDLALFTADPMMTDEILLMFDFLKRKTDRIASEALLIAPFTMRERFYQLIDREIAAAKRGERAEMILKMNSIEDTDMIEKLYEASNAGVKIQIIVRGICCLQPGIPKQSENINVISIIDRFLEHARIFIFHNGGDAQVYAASADWMNRNLSHRVELAFPIRQADLKQEIIDIVQLQLRDNQKARVIDKALSNRYQKTRGAKIRSQVAIYQYLKKKNG
jgi:polyphosphate kinase